MQSVTTKTASLQNIHTTHSANSRRLWYLVVAIILIINAAPKSSWAADQFGIIYLNVLITPGEQLPAGWSYEIYYQEPTDGQWYFSAISGSSEILNGYNQRPTWINRSVNWRCQLKYNSKNVGEPLEQTCFINQTSVTFDISTSSLPTAPYWPDLRFNNEYFFKENGNFSRDLAAGSAANFRAEAQGTAPLSYQWLKNGSAIPGATNITYSIPSVSASDAGGYSYRVSNSIGSATSVVGTISVTTPPSITSQPSSLSVSAGTNATFAVSATGSAPLSYQWRKNGTNISSATNTSYSITTVSANDAGTYSCVVSNSAGSVTSSNATLTVISATPPSITSQPSSLSVSAGTNATFAVSATGSAPLSYQWRKNGTNISSATNTSYSITTVSANDAGTYSCVVSNSAGSVTSSNAILTVVDSIDTDGDGLPDAWENGTLRYQVIEGSFTWQEAKGDAEARGGHMATVTTQDEQSVILQVTTSYSQPTATFWAGGSDSAAEGQWNWVTGEAWSYTGPGWSPDNSGDEDYLSIAITPANQEPVGWNDAGASFRNQKFPYILEFGYPSNPSKADTDDDGFNDKVESVAGSDPNDPASVPQDSDGDGLIDSAEKALQTLGFDWQTPQSDLVRALFDGAYLAGLHTAQYVTNNPSAFGLFSRSQFDSNRVAGRNDVTTNPGAYNLYTSNSIMDLRMGGVMIQKHGSNAIVEFQPQLSTNLTTDPFEDHGSPVTWTIPMPAEKGFIRIRAK